jgi:hypothetical protein
MTREETMMWRKPLCWFWLAASLALPTPPRAADRPDSPAQAALFESDHLGNIPAPVRLEYSFVRRGDPARAYDDRVEAEIKTIHANGGRDVWINFLSGERQMPAAPVIDFHGNPLLMYFLEHDVLEMRQETGHPAAYFRNRIRRAFIDRARSSQISIDLAGKTVPATRIDIAPFGDDPNLADLPAIAGKSYLFILSSDVPGTLYQISSRTPPSEQNAGVDEVMTYSGEAP